MNKELENRLVARWPRWFDTQGDVRHTLMSSGFAHGDGWFEIIWRLCEELEPLVNELERATGSKFEILQVKEKLGGLRIHANQTDDAIRQHIEDANQSSLRTCEVCGAPITPRDISVSKTVCDQHARAVKAEL